MAPATYTDGNRVGFQLVDVLSGETVEMAHVDFETGPTVGKYRVDVGAVDRLCSTAFERANAGVDLFIVDEIAPMEMYSEVFVDAVSQALDAPIPLVGVVHGSDAGFIGSVKSNEEVEVITVTTDNRDGLPARLADRVESVARDI
jgi:nucleoside-triphosphatase